MTGELACLPKKRRREAPLKLQDFEREECEMEKLNDTREIWGVELEKRQVPTRKTIGGLLDASWDELEPHYGDCSLDTLELAKFYVPHFSRILERRVSGGIFLLV